MKLVHSAANSVSQFYIIHGPLWRWFLSKFPSSYHAPLLLGLTPLKSFVSFAIFWGLWLRNPAVDSALLSCSFLYCPGCSFSICGPRHIDRVTGIIMIVRSICCMCWLPCGTPNPKFTGLWAPAPVTIPWSSQEQRRLLGAFPGHWGYLLPPPILPLVFFVQLWCGGGGILLLEYCFLIPGGRCWVFFLLAGGCSVLNIPTIPCCFPSSHSCSLFKSISWRKDWVPNKTFSRGWAQDPWVLCGEQPGFWKHHCLLFLPRPTGSGYEIKCCFSIPGHMFSQPSQEILDHGMVSRK